MTAFLVAGHMQNLPFFLAVAKTIASTHYVYPQRDGQAEWARYKAWMEGEGTLCFGPLDTSNRDLTGCPKNCSPSGVSHLYFCNNYCVAN